MGQQEDMVRLLEGERELGTAPEPEPAARLPIFPKSPSTSFAVFERDCEK